MKRVAFEGYKTRHCMQEENAPELKYFLSPCRTFGDNASARRASPSGLLPDSCPTQCTGGPVLHFAVCLLTLITAQEVIANEARLSSCISFCSSGTRTSRSCSATRSSRHHHRRLFSDPRGSRPPNESRREVGRLQHQDRPSQGRQGGRAHLDGSNRRW